MEEASAAATTATNDNDNGNDNDSQALSDLLRSMTTTTTIERFDEPKTRAVVAEKMIGLPSIAPDDATSTAATTAIGGSRLPQESSVPTSISRSYKIWGIPTHAFCQIFSDRIVIGVTQLQTKSTTTNEEQHRSSSGHIGSWVYCQASRSPIDPKQVDYELSTLLGGGNKNKNNKMVDEKEVYARRVAERLLEKKSVGGGTERIVLLLGISLLPIQPPPSPSSIDRFKVLVEVLVELVEEALGILTH